MSYSYSQFSRTRPYPVTAPTVNPIGRAIHLFGVYQAMFAWINSIDGIYWLAAVGSFYIFDSENLKNVLCKYCQSCYKRFDIQLTWNFAKAACESHASSLALVPSEYVSRAIQNSEISGKGKRILLAVCSRKFLIWPNGVFGLNFFVHWAFDCMCEGWWGFNWGAFSADISLPSSVDVRYLDGRECFWAEAFIIILCSLPKICVIANRNGQRAPIPAGWVRVR